MGIEKTPYPGHKLLSFYLYFQFFTNYFTDKDLATQPVTDRKAEQFFFKNKFKLLFSSLNINF